MWAVGPWARRRGRACVYMQAPYAVQQANLSGLMRLVPLRALQQGLGHCKVAEHAKEHVSEDMSPPIKTVRPSSQWGRRSRGRSTHRLPKKRSKRARRLGRRMALIALAQDIQQLVQTEIEIARAARKAYQEAPWKEIAKTFITARRTTSNGTTATS